MAEHKNDEEQEPIRVNTREEFEDALDELFADRSRSRRSRRSKRGASTSRTREGACHM